ncbi:hypothetical protein [Alkaliphilus metalliredigens]|nr:hypothetical protein [Alkaliphilus metalliredigens]
MKRKNEFYRMVGFLIYLVIATIDRFVIKIPNLIYIGITFVAIIFVVYGLLNQRVD